MAETSINRSRTVEVHYERNDSQRVRRNRGKKSTNKLFCEF